MTSLSQNAIRFLYENPEQTSRQLSLQVLDIKKISANNVSSSKSDRYRLILSDGSHFQQAMVTTKLNQLITSATLKLNCIVCLKQYICNEVQGRKIVIVLDLEVTGMENDRIGNPVNISGGKAHVAAKPAPSAATSSARQQTSSYKPSVGSAAMSNVRIFPIKGLNPYQNKWTIKARVTKKGDVRTWSNARGEGKLFSADLIDKDGTEIRCTFFKEAVDKFYDLLQQGSVYTFSGGRLKIANKRFTSIPNDYEITFNTDSTILPAGEDTTIKVQTFAFTKLNDVESKEVGALIDVVGVVTVDNGLSSVTSKKTQREIPKRDLQIVDETGTGIRVTLWGDEAKDERFTPDQTVLAVKAAKIGDFSGRSLSVGFASTMMVNPDIPEAKTVRQWYNAGGKSQAVTNLSSGGGGGRQRGFDERKFVASIKDENLGHGDKADYIDVVATVNYIRHDDRISYPACPDPDNNKKVIQQTDGSWLCEANGKAYDKPEHRYILSMTLADHTGTTWVTAFNDIAKDMLGGKTADNVLETKEQNEAEYENIFNEANFTERMFTFRVKAEEVQDETRIKVSIVRAKPINFVEESNELIKALERL